MRNYGDSALNSDQANRLVQVANQNTPVASYLHNFIGERVGKSAGGNVTHFHYDRAGHLIAESDGAGNVLREHIWLNDMPVGFVAGGALYYVHPDHLGTPQRITDAGQNVVWDIALAPFGAVAQLTPSLTENLRFPGQYADGETGLSYNYFRDYDPSIGRYVESDLIGLRGGVNTYAYVHGNPISGKDPLGLDAYSTCFRACVVVNAVACTVVFGETVVFIVPCIVATSYACEINCRTYFPRPQEKIACSVGSQGAG